MKKNISTILMIALLSFSYQTHAFYAEPFVAYGMGKFGQNNQTITGFNYGARLGLEHGNRFMYGLEYMGGTWTVKSSTVGMSVQNIGLIVQYTQSIKLNFTFYPLAKLSYSDSSLSGTGMRFGIDIPLGANFYLLLNYALMNYTKATVSSQSSSADTKSSMAIVGLSYVF